MAKTFDQSLDEIARLVKHYQTNRTAFHAPGYKEAHARQNLIDPLFIALDWDVYNAERAAPQYQPVVLEDSLETEMGKKAPDYAFRIGRDPAFFAEAKKPAESIKTNPDHAYQLRRYAWSAKLPLSILTDFEELAVYDCRARPSDKDKVSVGRINYLTFEEYPDRWRELWDVFSYGAVRSGSFDAYAQTAKGKRGTGEVDAEFLKEIEHWRDVLARNIALRNPRLTIDELNDAVQRTIDRLIFLRMAEDRGIEPYGKLLALTPTPSAASPVRKASTGEESVYAGLIDLCRAADAKYNSGLFDFSPRGDALALKLKVDDSVLKPIMAGLYYPQSPYEFSVLPAEILGSVYEQFLGKVIRLTPSHHAKVEEKPEVKKAGGVYYTPAYIVEYIVKNTVGKLVEGKAPKQLEGFRVLDMACGSGSFLLGAYQHLLDYYLRWYVEHNPEKHPKAVWRPPLSSPPQSRGDRGWEWRLTTAEKKRILTTHIFGVDIDRQAAEVTKLSLLLKVLEGESDETLGQQLALLPERALPNLDQNIKCGNSLIGPDYFSGQLMPDTEELKRVNPFDWEREFPGAMKTGGFDCVIGNPPYVRQESLAEIKSYVEQHYETYHSTADLYVYFVEKGLQLIRPGGLFSIIVSSSFLRTNYAVPLRRHVRQVGTVLEVVDFGGLSLFANAKDVYVCIPLLGKQPQPKHVPVCKIRSLSQLDLDAYVREHQHRVPAASFAEDGWSLEDDRTIAVFDKIKGRSNPLGEYVQGKIFYGLKTGLNEAFEIDEVTRDTILSRAPHCRVLIKLFLGGQDIRRYFVRDTKRFLIVVPSGWTAAQMKQTRISEREAWSWFSKTYKPIAQHLGAFEEAAKRRQDMGEFWWELRPCDYYDVLEKPKIIYPDIAKQPRFFFDTSGTYIANTAYCLASDDLYLLGLLNSKLSWFSVSRVSIPFGVRAGEFRYRLIYQYMEKLPIRPIDFTDPADRARHDKIVSLVQQMLDLHNRLAAATAPRDREVLQRQIDATDKQIDALVYELYELTEDEIRVVEGG